METVEKRCPKCNSMMQSVKDPIAIGGSAVFASQVTTSGNTQVGTMKYAFVCEVCGHTEISNYPEPFHS